MRAPGFTHKASGSRRRCNWVPDGAPPYFGLMVAGAELRLWAPIPQELAIGFNHCSCASACAFTIKKVGTSQLQRDASVLSHCTRALLSFLHGTPTFLMIPRYPGAGRVAYGVMAGRAGNLIFNQHRPLEVDQKLQLSLDFIRRRVIWLHFVLAPGGYSSDLACAAIW